MQAAGSSSARFRPTIRKSRRPDITKAKRVLGWEPKVPLEEGIAVTVEYFRTKVGAGSSKSADRQQPLPAVTTGTRTGNSSDRAH